MLGEEVGRRRERINLIAKEKEIQSQYLEQPGKRWYEEQKSETKRKRKKLFPAIYIVKIVNTTKQSTSDFTHMSQNDKTQNYNP